MVKELIQLAAVLAITLFLSVAHGQVNIIDDHWNGQVALSSIVVNKGVALAELVYDKELVKGGRLTVIMAPLGVLKDTVGGYYDFRVRTVYINPEIWLTLTLKYKIYIIAHEVGHHFLRIESVNDHCEMYGPGGYDHQVLDLMGVTGEDVWDYIDPFMSILACGPMEY